MEGQLKALSEKELLYCEAYFTNNFNKTAAAITATGCKKENARTVGFEMYSRPHVKAYIQNYLKQNTIDGDETVKLVSQIAQSDIKDYYRPVQVLKSTKVKKPLSEIIEGLKDEVSTLEEFSAAKGFSGEAAENFRNEHIAPIEDQIMMYEIQFRKNPSATKIVTVEDMVTEMQLDMDLLVADKERGKVKKIKYGKDGLEVEMYAADAAQDKLLKVHGKYEKDNERVVKITSNVTPEQAKEISKALEFKY